MRTLTWRRSPVILVALSLLAGCAGRAGARLDPGELARLRRASAISIVHYPTPAFQQADPGAGAGWSAVPLLGIVAGSIAAAAAAQRAVAEGERIRRAYELEDPVLRVADRVVTSLREQHGFSSLDGAERRFLSTDDPGELRRALGPGAAIDFGTAGWGLVRQPKVPFATARYRVHYAVRARLVLLAEETVLWGSLCASNGREPKGSWTLEELTQQDAALLKAKIAEAAGVCVEQLLANLAGGPTD